VADFPFLVLITAAAQLLDPFRWLLAGAGGIIAPSRISAALLGALASVLIGLAMLGFGESRLHAGISLPASILSGAAIGFLAKLISQAFKTRKQP
jgi:hypothetical protein